MENKRECYASGVLSTDEKKEITVTVNGRLQKALSGLALSEIALGEKPCGGHGRCGKCRVVARGELSALTEAEKRLLTAKELASGIRLACMTYARGDCEIETLVKSEERILTAGALPKFDLQPSFSKYGVAVDIGTTTLAARLYDSKGNLLAEAAESNPQGAYGADVVSRIEAALGGEASALAVTIRNALDGMIKALAEKAQVNEKEIDGIVITGNTVMLSLLTGESVEPFSHAPFAAKRLFGETVTAKALGIFSLQQDTPVYLPPCISAFVGADTACAILATNLCKGGSALLADIGTNGEMALWHGGKLTVCSTAAGPAFEGVGISMGMQGAVGAIDQVRLSEDQCLPHVIGEGTPKGICGSGLVDAVACMLELEALDESGYLEDDPFVIKEPVLLTQQDIRMLQLAKSAICAGLLTLLKNAGIHASEVSALYIAGGFGNYLSKESAARIGLLPKALAERAMPVGNAALSGASMLLLNAELRREAEAWAHAAHVSELATDPGFSERFMSGMMLEFVLA